MGTWPVAFSLAFLLIAGCGPKAELERAKKLERTGKRHQAWVKYQEFAAHHPGDPRAPEALFRAGWLAERELKDCPVATNFYDQVVERYPQSDPWARIAALQKRNCPDYFPLLPGTQWVEGDSDTGGKNARIEVAFKPAGKKYLPSEAGVLSRTYYGGQTKFKTIESFYRKTESELLEFKSEDAVLSKTILQWPVVVGNRWKTKSDLRLFSYEIVAVDKKITVAGGTFEGCVQVRYSIEGSHGSTNEYYAPGVGKILTAIATNEGEKRNTELLSYKPGVFPDFEPAGSDQ